MNADAPSRTAPDSVTTLGIDLASQPENTAVCHLTWREERVEVRLPERGRDGQHAALTDERLITLMRGDASAPAPTTIGIDAPLGWPLGFRAALSDPENWPLGLSNDALARRSTDRWIRSQTGKVPLSVSTDRIAYPAFRAARILRLYQDRVGVDAIIDRTGMTGPVAEVYPDTAVTRFGLRPDDNRRLSYKGPRGSVGRTVIVERLNRAAPWLALSGADRRACVDSDDCLDALVAALIARAVQLGLTEPPPAELVADAALEGWIHLPREGALAALAPVAWCGGEALER